MIIKKSEQLDIIAGMTKRLFEDENSDVVMSLDGFEKRLLDAFDKGACAYLFYEDDIIGYALVNLSRNPHYLIDFFIDRPYRRGGKGTEAFHALLEELKTECLDLDVFCWNGRGRKFWDSLGFKERAVIMRRQVQKGT